MLGGRLNLISTSRHLVQSRSVLRNQTGPLHSRPEVIFEHAEVLAINKPPGVPFHSTDHISGVIPTLRCMETEGLLPTLGPLYPLHRSNLAQLSLSTCLTIDIMHDDACIHASEKAAVHQSQQALTPNLVDRLDEVTSGIMLLARSHHTAQKLSIDFAEGRVSKCYIALSDRKPKKKQGTIRGDMTKGRRGSWKLLHTTENPAVTKFTSFGVPDIRPGLRMFVVRPLTGRTHQIRVAMKSVGSSILGDTRYADKTAAEQEDRAYLHAAAITFTLAGQTFHIVCQPNVGAQFLHVAFQTAWLQRQDTFISDDAKKDAMVHICRQKAGHPRTQEE